MKFGIEYLHVMSLNRCVFRENRAVIGIPKDAKEILSVFSTFFSFELGKTRYIRVKKKLIEL